MRKNKLAIFSVILFCLVVGATFCCGENMVADAQGSYVYLGGYPIGISATALENGPKNVVTEPIVCKIITKAVITAPKTKSLV